MKTRIDPKAAKQLNLDKRFGKNLSSKELNERIVTIQCERFEKHFNCIQKQPYRKEPPKAILEYDKEKRHIELIPHSVHDDRRINAEYNRIIVSLLSGMKKKIVPKEDNDCGHKSGRSFQHCEYRFFKTESALRENGFTLSQLSKRIEEQLNLKSSISPVVIKHFFISKSDYLYDHILHASQKNTFAMKTEGYSQIANHVGKPNLKFSYDDDLVDQFNKYLLETRSLIKELGIETDIDIYK